MIYTEIRIPVCEFIALIVKVSEVLCVVIAARVAFKPSSVFTTL